MPRRKTKLRFSGVALIEALVALAVMAFGLLAVVGVQVTLRQNADTAKQRAEAVRLAQAEIEAWRAFPSLTVGTNSYANLATGTQAAVPGSNAQYTLTRTVTESAAPNAAYKVLRVDVSWVDRNGASQSVRFSSGIAGVAPELAGTVSVPWVAPSGQSGGRNAAIPAGAKSLDSTTSGFRPPQPTGSSSVVWKFNNTTALITVCATTATTTSALTLANITGCSDSVYQLLTGFINFATALTPPTGTEAENPPSASAALGVSLVQTVPSAQTVGCFSDQQSLFVAYYCAVPVVINSGGITPWAGRSLVAALVSGSPPLTDDVAAASPTQRRVCRYTPFRDDRTVSSGTITNAQHPLDYAGVRGPLPAQNFLVIAAGNGSIAFDCPQDTANPVYNTWRHPLLAP